jgi:hypothetical protein
VILHTVRFFAVILTALALVASGADTRLGTDGSQTHRWREPDSNHQFREGVVGAFANFPGAGYFG